MSNPWDNDPIATPTGKGSYKPTPDDAAVLKNLGTELQQKRLLAQRSQQAMAVQGTGKNAVATGPLVAPTWGHLPILGDIPNPIRAAMNVVDPGDAQRLARLDQINAETWANLRPVGSGRMTTQEAQGFKEAIPSSGQWGQNNADATSQFQKEYQDALASANFVHNYVTQGKGSAAEAQAMWEANQGGGGSMDGGGGSVVRSNPLPAPNANAALIARSAAARAPAQAVPNGATVDIFGRPVQ